MHKVIRKKISLFIIFIVFGSVCIIGFNAKKRHFQTKDKHTHRSTVAHKLALKDFAFTKYAYTDTKVSNKDYILEGKTIGIKSKSIGVFKIAAAKVINIKNVRMTIFDKNGANPITTITADKAIKDLAATGQNNPPSISNELIQHIDFLGKVKLTTQDQRSLQCDTMRFDNEKRELEARGDCLLSYANKTISTDFLKTDTGLKKFNFSK